MMSCLDEKTIAFVGDSHVRNAFRCVADLLTGGSSAHALPHYGEAWNDPEEPSDWPKYYHLDMISVDPAEESKRGRHSNEVPDALLTGTTQLHTLSCENHVKVHRHDYSFTAKGPHGTSVKLEFFWQPWGGSKPLLESQDVVEQMGLESAVYRCGPSAFRVCIPPANGTEHGH